MGLPGVQQVKLHRAVGLVEEPHRHVGVGARHLDVLPGVDHREAVLGSDEVEGGAGRDEVVPSGRDGIGHAHRHPVRPDGTQGGSWVLGRAARPQ